MLLALLACSRQFTISDFFARRNIVKRSSQLVQFQFKLPYEECGTGATKYEYRYQPFLLKVDSYTENVITTNGSLKAIVAEVYHTDTAEGRRNFEQCAQYIEVRMLHPLSLPIKIEYTNLDNTQCLRDEDLSTNLTEIFRYINCEDDTLGNWASKVPSGEVLQCKRVAIVDDNSTNGTDILLSSTWVRLFASVNGQMF